jgi:hypothetical protein
LPGPDAAPSAIVRRLLILIAIYFIPMQVAMQVSVDPDLWWHLRTGQWIVENGTVPQTDPFSSYGEGRPWLAYSWLFEVFIYGLYTRVGFLGVLLYRMVMCLLVVAALHRLLRKWQLPLLMEGLLLGVAATICAQHMRERPWLVTILFWILTLDLVLDLRAGRRSQLLWLLPACYVIWANVHIQFVHGLLLLGLACIAPLIDRLAGLSNRRGHAAKLGSREWKQLVAVTGLCVLATLVNPYHVRLYGVVYEYGSHTHVYDVVDELRAMSFRSPFDWLVLLLTLAATAALSRRPLASSFEVLLLAIAVYFSFHSLRDVWLMAVVSVVILAESIPPALQGGQRLALTLKRCLVIAAGLAVLLGAVASVKGLSEAAFEAAVTKAYPEKAASYVSSQDYRGPLYNHFNWGGYFIWAVPELKVMMDGRTNLHGDERIQRSLDTWNGRTGWDEDPELQAAGVVIAEKGFPLVALLRTDRRFREVPQEQHGDELAVIFVRVDKPAR